MGSSNRCVLATSNTPKAGTVLDGKYRVEHVIGRGGAGIVVAAVHRELRQRVAIKLLRADADGEQEERFLREARAAVHLQGQHSVRVLDVGHLPDGKPYVVMEMLQGEDLGHVVERGRLPLVVAVDYVLQACEGLAEAHGLGIVHRDIKPRNLFVARRTIGRPIVKILDFGIAKTRTLGPGPASLTQASTVMGTPHYMSPEQARDSKDVDARADIWSLGVSLYELLAGRVPFDGPSMADIFARVFTATPPPLNAIRRDVPGALARLVEQCLAKDPAGRPGDVAELAAALEPFGSDASRGAAARARAALQNVAPSFHPASFSPQALADETRTVAISNSTHDIPPARLRSALAVAAALVVAGTILGLHTARNVQPSAHAVDAVSPIRVASPLPCSAPSFRTVDASGGWTEVPPTDAGRATAAASRASSAGPGARPSVRPTRRNGGRTPSGAF